MVGQWNQVWVLSMSSSPLLPPQFLLLFQGMEWFPGQHFSLFIFAAHFFFFFQEITRVAPGLLQFSQSHWAGISSEIPIPGDSLDLATKRAKFSPHCAGVQFSSRSGSWEENLLPIFSFLNILSPRFRHWIIWNKPIQCCLDLYFIHHRRVKGNGTRNTRIPFSGDKDELWGAWTELPWRNKYLKSMWNCCIPTVSLHYFVSVISSPLDLKNSKVNNESV